MRLIDADALLKGKQDHTYISTHLIWNAPTVDPIKHGKWERDTEWYFCSECGWSYKFYITLETYKYCPNCGARMREVTE